MHIYETHKMKDPRLPFIFHVTHRQKRAQETICNWHENVEIISVTAGGGLVTCGEQRFSVVAGDVVVINQNELHSFSTAEEEMDYFCLIVDRSFFLANHFDSNDFHFESKIKNEALSALIGRFGYFWESDKQTEPMRVQHLRALALAICLEICEKHSSFDRNPREESHLLSCVKQAIGYIRAESNRDISLDELASAVGLSKYYFAREFRRITGYSFISYLNVIRCEKARELLTTDRLSVGDIGRTCGFANQSYFTRTFRMHTGLTPGDYRKQHQNGI